MIGTARELILRVEDGKPILSVIGITLDEQHLDLVVQHTLDSVDVDENQLKRDLAYAAILEVPVYPNDDVAAELLVRLHTQLLTSGFVEDGEGTSKRCRLNVARAVEFADGKLVDGVSHAGAGPVEVLLMRAQAARRRAEQDEAARVLATLRTAISELRRLLDAGTRDEAALQQCLTSYPILFGLEYQRIIPKHSLGGEFEVDFALLRHSGLIDLVEIEPSTFRLYTKAGDPRAELVHAEQQVLDWLDWIELHSEYARYRLPGVLSPRGYVVIGSSRDMTETERRRLQRRNIGWNGRLEIHTYESLLERAQTILAALLGNLR